LDRVSLIHLAPLRFSWNQYVCRILFGAGNTDVRRASLICQITFTRSIERQLTFFRASRRPSGPGPQFLESPAQQ
jgi:hypothetical protein